MPGAAAVGGTREVGPHDELRAHQARAGGDVADAGQPAQFALDQGGVFGLLPHGGAVFAIHGDIQHTSAEFADQIGLQLQGFGHALGHAAVVIDHGQNRTSALGAEQDGTGGEKIRHSRAIVYANAA